MLNHRTNVGYADSFSDGASRNTFAYPTATTDPDNYSSAAQYDYNFGGVTRATSPKGAVQTMEYDGARRRTKATVQLGANTDYSHTRWFYSDGMDWVATHQTVKDSQEHVSFTWNDGAGRIHGAGGELPNSSGGFFVQKTVYDVLGRPSAVTNPTEIAGTVVPAGDDAAAGFVWTYQQYDWKGRPTLTTLPSTDGGQTSATVELSYGGCGCAGGEVTTVRDERGRRRRLTKDVVGRLAKVEELNWDQSVYSTTAYAYNARNQVTQINQAGQTRTFEFDGYGRLWRTTTPEQGQTTYSYFADDTVQTVTDARGASSTFAYYNRHFVKDITYGVPAGVAATPNVHFEYDEAGNRTSMTDGLGSATYHYDQLSRMDWEERTFSGVGTYRTGYGYDVSGQLTSVTNNWGYGFSYARDYMGRVTDVNSFGTPYAGVSTYLSNVRYRASGAMKDASYGNGKALSMGYDNRLRLSRWDVAGVLGYQYYYNYFNENSGRVTFASQLYDHTLDRSYDYDHVGRMWGAHSGREARWHTGQEAYSGADGPYAQNQAYDQWGNTVQRNGWGGWNPSESASYTNNRRNDLTYDAAGNVTFDGSALTYDATGQQATAVYGSSWNIQNNYDGDGLRVKKTENGAVTYYLRSSLLGGKAIAELNVSGQWSRGYVYLGGQILALQDGSARWVHQDPVTKSQRLTDAGGNVVSTVELDPWGGETYRSSNQALQPHRYTTYERDVNGRDEAMMRQHHSWFRRFDQPDPYDGSYDLTDPQSFNRYSYVQNDPVNFVDPTGLFISVPPDIGNVGTVTVTTNWDDLVSAGYLPDITQSGGPSILLGPISPERAGGVILHELGHTFQQPQKTPEQGKASKCQQSPNGGDVPEILRYLTVYGLMGFIDPKTIRHSVNPKTGGVGEGIQFQLYNRADAVSALSSSPHFVNAHLGFEHNGQVGGKNLDFRGIIGSDPNKGSGATKSLQFVVGPAGAVPDAPERALGYADLDCDNPGQGPGSFLRHIFK